MLSKLELRNIDEYVENCLSPISNDYDELDKFILTCCDLDYAIKNKNTITEYIEILREEMSYEFTINFGITPSLIASQERFYQLKIILGKTERNEKISIHNIAMLCIASSFDLMLLMASK